MYQQMLKERGHIFLCYILHLTVWNLDVRTVALTVILDHEDKNHREERVSWKEPDHLTCTI